MEEIIRSLRGHHERQEEAVFHAMTERLRDEPEPRMIEFGAFWSYYSLWFLHALPGGLAVGIEPDPANLDVGLRNAALNRLDHRFDLFPGAVGPNPGEPITIPHEQGAGSETVVQHDIASLLEYTGWGHVDLALV